jgi:hypothetical protein
MEPCELAVPNDDFRHLTVKRGRFTHRSRRALGQPDDSRKAGAALVELKYRKQPHAK